MGMIGVWTFEPHLHRYLLILSSNGSFWVFSWEVDLEWRHRVDHPGVSAPCGRSCIPASRCSGAAPSSQSGIRNDLHRKFQDGGSNHAQSITTNVMEPLEIGLHLSCPLVIRKSSWESLSDLGNETRHGQMSPVAVIHQRFFSGETRSPRPPIAPALLGSPQSSGLRRAAKAWRGVSRGAVQK